jgi:hypothetical protein
MSKTIFFVSAFITNIHKNDKSIENYIVYGKKMIHQNMKQIIFLEKNIFYDYFKEYDNEPRHIFDYENKIFEYININDIYFMFFEKKDIYLYDYKSDITNFQISTNNPGKDTIDYMFVQCHKTEWIKMSVFFIKQKQETNMDNLDLEFIWLDFGIYHIIKNDEIFETEIKKLNERSLLNVHKKIRIGGIWNLNNNYGNIYTNIAWYFAGGIFGGNSIETLIDFADIMKKKCLEIIKERNSFIWEVNIWYLIHLEYPNLFDIYQCDHNVSMLTNY